MTAPADGAQRAGGLADDAARLIAELRDSIAVTQLAAHAAAQAVEQEAARPQHTGASCRACPVCLLLDVVRQVRPEVIDHLAAAMTELGLAARELLNAVSAGDPGAPGAAPAAGRAPAGAAPNGDRAADDVARGGAGDGGDAVGEPGREPGRTASGWPVVQRIDIS